MTYIACIQGFKNSCNVNVLSSKSLLRQLWLPCLLTAVTQADIWNGILLGKHIGKGEDREDEIDRSSRLQLRVLSENSATVEHSVYAMKIPCISNKWCWHHLHTFPMKPKNHTTRVIFWFCTHEYKKIARALSQTDVIDKQGLTAANRETCFV